MSLANFGRELLVEVRRIAEATVRRDGTSLRWATITNTDPLRIRYDGETNESIVPPQTLAARLEIGDRVRIAKQNGQATILERAGGPPPPDRIVTNSGVGLRIGANGSLERNTGAGWGTYPDDTGWVKHTSGMLRSGETRTRVRDGVVFLRVEVTESVGAGAEIQVYAGLPASLRPDATSILAGAGAGNRPATGSCNTAGNIWVRNQHTAAISSMTFSGTWPL